MTPFEKQLCELAAWALDKGRDEDLRSMVVKDFVFWKWSTRDKKHLGCPYWSVNAIEQHKTNRSKAPRAPMKDLRHEHIIPRAYLYNMLIQIQLPLLCDRKIEMIEKFLRDNCIGCIITKAEETQLDSKFRSSMPDGWQVGDHTWARYQKAFNAGRIVIMKVDSKLNKNGDSPF